MIFDSKKKTAKPVLSGAVKSSASRTAGFDTDNMPLACRPAQLEEGLYDMLRAQVPIIDAAITKVVRLTGGFKLRCADERAEKQMAEFFAELPVPASGRSLDRFCEMYLDSLLTYGRAMGEILVSGITHEISGLYCADCTLFRVRAAKDMSRAEFYSAYTGEKLRCMHPERVLYTVQNPSAQHPEGVSLLRGLPALSGVLLRIFETVGQNLERAGNVRYAVTYKPSGEGEAAYAKERAMDIAREWADGMAASKAGQVKDFIAVGDVEIKVIGADGAELNTEIPVRQLLEQLIAKLSIPPFLLGLNWSTTERMSSQQADILTSEIDYYRRLLEQAILKIARFYADMNGISSDIWVEWENVNLQDEESLARARLCNAQAQQIELENQSKMKMNSGKV